MNMLGKILVLLTSKTFWAVILFSGAIFFVNKWIKDTETNIRNTITAEIESTAKSEEIEALKEQIKIIKESSDSNKETLADLKSKNQEVKVVTKEVVERIIEPAPAQPIKELSPVIAATSEALAADWEKRQEEKDDE